MRLKYFLSIAVFTTLFESCVKERGVNFANQESSSPITADFPNQNEAAALDIVATPTIYTFYVELNTPSSSKPSTTITIVKNVAIVSTAGHEFLPDSAYQLVNNTAVVNPTTGQAAFQLSIKTTKIDLTHDFAVGFTISATTNGVIATNKNNIVIVVGAKNRYDGAYSLKIKTVGWAAYAIADGTTGTYPGEYQLITTGANTVSGFSTFRGDNLQPAFTPTGGATGFGATTPLFTFDNATNKLIAVTNTTPDDGRGRKLAINPAVTDSRFDPATKTIYAAYLMTQTGRNTQFIYDTLTYLHSR